MSNQHTDPTSKGKAPTKPVPICPTTIAHDLFDWGSSQSSSASTSSQCASPGSPFSMSSGSESPSTSYDEAFFASIQSTFSYSNSEAGSPRGKGKDKAPMLPPLSFSGIGLDYEQTSFMPTSISPSLGPSSYDPLSMVQDISVSASETSTTRSPPPIQSVDFSNPRPLSRHTPSHCHSLSLPTQPVLSPITSSTLLLTQPNPNCTQSNLTRKLLNNPSGPEPSSIIMPESPFVTFTDPTITNWYSSPLKYDSDGIVLSPASVRSTGQEERSSFKSNTPRLLLKRKGRSHSAPTTFSALDFIPVSSTDIFSPLPLPRRNYIDQVLPRELRIHIFKFVVQLFEDEHDQYIGSNRWTISKATSFKYQLVGKDRGIKELFKLSRVSRSWQTLAFDGQLWSELDLRSFPGLPRASLLRLARIGGPFIRKLSFAGHCHLQASTLSDVSKQLCPQTTLSYTNLTSINLQGCSALTTKSLHHLLVRSRSLRKLCLKGLSAVTNVTCELLAAFCINMESLNLNRCSNMDAEGIRCLSQTALAQGEYLRLKELRVSGLKGVDDTTMRLLGKAAPHLEVLDLSYTRKLHNSALAAFVSVDKDSISHPDTEVVHLSVREIGRSDDDGHHMYTRRVTKLRHISFSFCKLLTDAACSNIAYSVPRLEFLELAGIGANLKDEGLTHLLRTTPHIRRLDLEDAIEITDSVLECITPDMEDISSDSDKKKDELLQPGKKLEWLAVSHAENISDAAFVRLIRGCEKLRVLEADNTHISSSTLKEFVHLCRNRKMFNAKLVTIDCRGVTEGTVKKLANEGATRPRLGMRTFWARGLCYVDGRDGACEEDLKIGQDECDTQKVVVKSFYSWQTVDSVKAARERRKKAISRRAGTLGFSTDVDNEFGRGSNITRWWSPGGRSGNGSNSPPLIPDLSNDGCILM